MAIIINKDVNVSGGILINGIYCRINYQVDIFGTSIGGYLFPYVSKEAFSSNWQENVLKVDNLELNHTFSYDSSSNGDPLVYFHNKVKEYLSSEETRQEIVLDPSTGEVIFIQEPLLDPSTGLQMTDPSTGDLLWIDGDPSTRAVVIRAMFAQDSSISFVDLD